MEIQKNKVYRHYNGNLYLVEDLAIHTETNEIMVVYRALYEDYKLFVRPLSMFFDVLPKEKQEKYGQKCRFVLVDIKNKRENK